MTLWPEIGTIVPGLMASIPLLLLARRLYRVGSRATPATPVDVPADLTGADRRWIDDHLEFARTGLWPKHPTTTVAVKPEAIWTTHPERLWTLPSSSVAAANPVWPRIDLVVSDQDGRQRVIQGVPSVVPVRPMLPSGCSVVGEILVPAMGCGPFDVYQVDDPPRKVSA